MSSSTTGPFTYNPDDQFKTQALAGYPLGDVGPRAEYFTDFVISQEYAAADWVITTVEAGGSSATEAISGQELGGVLLITNDTNDTDSDQLQASFDGGTGVAEIWSLESTQRLWMTARFKGNDATDSALLVGLCITDTSLIAGMTDGLYFRKSDTDATLQAVAEKDSVESTLDIVEMADDTFVEVGMLWRAGVKVEVEVYFRNVTAQGGSIGAEFAQNSKEQWSLVGVLDTNLPDNEQLAVSFAVTNGAAAAKTLEIDYFQVAQERN